MSQEKLPISRVHDADNVFAFFCTHQEQQRAYRSCLNLVERVQAGEHAKYHTQPKTCAGAIHCGKCPALAMRQEEIDAGHAIHFLQRQGSLDRPLKIETPATSRIDRNSESYKRGWSMAGGEVYRPQSKRSAPVFSTPKADPPKPKTGFEAMKVASSSGAEAINLSLIHI